MSIIVEAAMLDTDFAIKVGRIDTKKIIEEIIPQFVGMLYIHKYIYDNEILTPPSVKQQLDSLIAQKRALVVDQEHVAVKGFDKELIYQQTRDLLKTNHGDEEKPRRNWGEIVSLAFAKTERITVFLSDEAGLQTVVDDYLNIGDPQADIRIVRVKDFIIWMKDSGHFGRKLCRMIWLISKEPEETLQHRKEVFDNEIWPL